MASARVLVLLALLGPSLVAPGALEPERPRMDVPAPPAPDATPAPDAPPAPPAPDHAAVLQDVRERLAELKDIQDLRVAVTELQTQNMVLRERLDTAEKHLKDVTVPKVAFSASLGGNGLVKTLRNKNLVYKDVLTNVGGAYNAETGVFTAPVRGVYYVRFTANGPSDYPLSSVLYRNGYQIVLIAHEQPSGRGSDTASNGAALLLEQGDTLNMVLWTETQVWDNSNRHTTFSGFLLFPLEA